jgi:chorismate mutase
MSLPPTPSLADIRAEIDRLDAAMHALLMERSEVIERLIAVKRTAESGSAFRPAREAEVLRMLVERHRGILPLDTVESIWRVIISTFTWVQAPHAVHGAVSAGDAAIRDSVRFHFGFTVPFIGHQDAAAVIAAVDGSKGDLGIFPQQAAAAGEAWWRRLEAASAPKIIARLPFVSRPDHPAGLPVFVVAKPLAEAAARDVVIASASVERWRKAMPEALDRAGITLLASGAAGDALSLLLSYPGTLTEADLRAALAAAGDAESRIQPLGGHAAPVVPVPSAPSAPPSPSVP